MDELPMNQGYAHIAWLIENQPFAEAEAKAPRYIAQESARLKALDSRLSPLDSQ